MITEIQKTQVEQVLRQYLEEHGMSANDFAKRAEINSSYVSHILNGKTKIDTTTIKDKYYKQIADKIGLAFEKQYWKTLVTPQYKRMFNTLEEAKEFGLTNIIIGESGSGKTFLSDLFVQANPVDTFKIVVGSLDTIGDLLDKIIDALKIATPKTKSKKVGEITKKLKSMKQEGFKPHIIFDESEYMKQPALCSMKELYDSLKGIAGITMIGTDQLIVKLDKLRKKNRDGIPQFYRRVKLGIRFLPGIDRTYKVFFESLGLEDRKLERFLKELCDNYGELHDVIVPALRQAEEHGYDLSEDFIRVMLGMPPVNMS